MVYLFYLAVFVLGTIIGSFINVVALRYNSGLSSKSGRSMCFSCSGRLKWYDMIPVLSYFFLRGRCRKCRSKFSAQYPIVEFLTGLIFVLIAIRQLSLRPLYSAIPHGQVYLILLSAFYCFVFSLLLALAIYDIHHKIIPDSFVYTFIVLSFLKLITFFWLNGFVLSKTDLLDFSSAFLLFGAFALIWLVSDGKWMGFGDAKLSFGIGAMLGFVSGISAIITAFWIGAAWSIFLLLKNKLSKKSKKKIGMKTEIPFAPFLILGTLLIFLTRVDVLGIGALLNLI